MVLPYSISSGDDLQTQMNKIKPSSNMTQSFSKSKQNIPPKIKGINIPETTKAHPFLGQGQKTISLTSVAPTINTFVDTPRQAKTLLFHITLKILSKNGLKSLVKKIF